MQKLNDMLNLPVIEDNKNVKKDLIIPENGISDNVEIDYKHTRKNLYNLLELGEDALLNALDVAKQSESARSYEVVGALLKNLSDINHQLMDLSEKTKKITEPLKGDVTTGNVTNNAIFVGSTAELSKFLKNNEGEK